MARNVTQTSTYETIIRRGLRPDEGRRILSQLQQQGKNVRFDQSRGRIIETRAYDQTVEYRNDQGQLTKREIRAVSGGKDNLVKIESYREGRRVQERNIKFKSGVNRGEDIVRYNQQGAGEVVLNTKGRLPRARDQTLTKTQIAQQQIKAMRAQDAAIRERAKNRRLVDTAQGLLFTPSTATQNQIPSQYTPSEANFSTAQGAQYVAPPSNRISLAQERAARTTADLSTFTGASFLPKSIREVVNKKALGSQAGEIVTKRQDQIVQESQTAAVRTAPFVAAGIGIAAINAPAIAGATAALGPVGGISAGGALLGSEAIVIDKGFDVYKDVTTPSNIRQAVSVARSKQRQAEEAYISQKGFFNSESIATGINPGLRSQPTRQVGRQAALGSLVEQGLSPSQVEQGLTELERRDRLETQQRILTDIPLFEAGTEQIGRAVTATGFKKLGTLTTSQALKETAKITIPRLGAVGAIEGGGSYLTEQLAKDQKVRATDLGFSAGVGAISAASIGFAIPATDILARTATRKTSRALAKGGSVALRSAVEVAETGKEFLGDVTADFTEAGVRRLSIPVVAPSISISTSIKSQSASSVPTTSKTTTKASTVTKVKEPSKIPGFSLAEVKEFGDVTKAPTQTPTKPVTKPTIKPFVPTPSNVQTPTFTEVTSPSTSRSSSTVSVNVEEPITIRTVVPDRFAVPIFEPSGPGGGGRRFKFPKYTRQRGGYTPSLAGLESGLTITSTPKFTPGIGIRLPTSNKLKFDRKSRSIFNAIGDSDFRFEVKPNVSTKKKKKKSKKKKSRK